MRWQIVQLMDQCTSARTAEQGMLLGYVLHADAAFHMLHLP